MVDDFKIFYIIWKTKECAGVFCGRSIFEFNNSWNLNQKGSV